MKSFTQDCQVPRIAGGRSGFIRFAQKSRLFSYVQATFALDRPAVASAQHPRKEKR